jgi:hypothetical protein
MAVSSMLHCWVVVTFCALFVVVSVLLSRKEDAGMPFVETRGLDDEWWREESDCMCAATQFLCAVKTSGL